MIIFYPLNVSLHFFTREEKSYLPQLVTADGAVGETLHDETAKSFPPQSSFEDGRKLHFFHFLIPCLITNFCNQVQGR